MFSDMGDDQGKISSARLAFRNINAAAQLRQIECIANESLVINLWATIEQIATRCLAIISTPASGKHAPYRWGNIESHYKMKNIILTKSNVHFTIDELSSK